MGFGNKTQQVRREIQITAGFSNWKEKLIDPGQAEILMNKLIKAAPRSNGVIGDHQYAEKIEQLKTFIAVKRSGGKTFTQYCKCCHAPVRHDIVEMNFKEFNRPLCQRTTCPKMKDLE